MGLLAIHKVPRELKKCKFFWTEIRNIKCTIVTEMIYMFEAKNLLNCDTYVYIKSVCVCVCVEWCTDFSKKIRAISTFQVLEG